MSFSKLERATLAGLADVLIPAANGFPSASQAGVAGEWLDRVLEARPDLGEGLRQVLTAAEGRDPAEVVAELQEKDAEALGILAEVVPGAYFMNPVVRKIIGYDGQTARAIDPKPDYMEDGLLESVIKRGPIYRPTPGKE